VVVAVAAVMLVLVEPHALTSSAPATATALTAAIRRIFMKLPFSGWA
jgi:hypothetical protein